MINKKIVIYIKKNSSFLMMMAKCIINFEITLIISANIVGTTHNICNLRYKIRKDIPVVFHKGSNFIIKELTEQFQGQI